MATLEEIWPVFGLRVEAGPVELSAIRDDDIPLLVDLASDGIHEPGAMPFATPWSTATDLGHEMAAYYWRTRAEFSPKAWTLDLLVRHEGVVVGCQGFHTRDFLVTGTGETGSWLGRPYQGRGIGTLMRQAICVTLFDHLGAEEITSAAFLDNPASLAVSRKLGYVDNGQIRRQRREGELAVTQQLLLRPDDLVRPTHPVHVEGAAAVRQLIGLPAQLTVLDPENLVPIFDRGITRSRRQLAKTEWDTGYRTGGRWTSEHAMRAADHALAELAEALSVRRPA